ncbi:MAG: alpha/beta hydrolase [bacterium]
MQPTDRFIEHQRGLRLHVAEWGAADAEPIVMVHGWMDIARSWDPVAERLAARYRVLAVDLRGHGLSGWVGAGGYYHFADYVLDIDAVVRELGGGRPVVLVGHSMGGMAAGLYAGTFPDRVRAYVSVEGLGPADMRPDTAPDQFAEWVRSNHDQLAKVPRPYRAIADAAAQLRLANPRLGEERALALATHGTERGGDGLFRWRFDPLHKSRVPQPFYVEQARAFWHRVTAPVLVVMGELSWVRDLVPDWRERAAAFRDVRLVELDGVGHMIHHERPEALADAMLAFLGSRGI